MWTLLSASGFPVKKKNRKIRATYVVFMNGYNLSRCLIHPPIFPIFLTGNNISQVNLSVFLSTNTMFMYLFLSCFP